MAEATTDDQTTLMAEAIADPPVEEEALPKPELPMAPEPVVGKTTATTDIQIPTWNLGERISIAPQIWDADTLQVGVGAADEDVDTITLNDSEITPVVPEPPKKSQKEKWKKKRKKAAQ
jgi:hypothetical protein